MLKTPNEFWLQLHRLADAYEAVGMTPDERAENIGHELSQLPPTVQRESIHDLGQLAVSLFDLYPMMLSKLTRQVEQAQERKPKGKIA